MHPLTVVTGVLLGSSVSITLSLAAVMIIYLYLGGEYPRVADEFGTLIESALIFLGLTIVSGMSFYSLLKNHASRWWLQLALWSGVAATTFHFWP